MKRCLFNLAAAVSLGMMLAVVALWIRSYWHYDSIVRVHEWSVDRASQPSTQVAVIAQSGTTVESMEACWGELTLKVRSERIRSSPSVLRLRAVGTPPDRVSWTRTSAPPYEPLRAARAFAWKSESTSSAGKSITEFYIVVPYCALVVILGIAPVLSLFLWQRNRRRLRLGSGLCSRCGYDLRATPEQCPECGNAVSILPTSSLQ